MHDEQWMMISNEQGSMISEQWTMNNEQGSMIIEQWSMKNKQGSVINEWCTINKE